MEKKLSFRDVLSRVKAVNKTLLNCGFSYKEIDVFWKDCISEVITREVIALCCKGLSDAEIAEKSRKGNYYVGYITINGLDKRITKN